MRKFVVVIFIAFLILFDFVTKVNMDEFAWYDECYKGSPAIVQDTYS
jgi:hypothetical protein